MLFRRIFGICLAGFVGCTLFARANPEIRQSPTKKPAPLRSVTIAIIRKLPDATVVDQLDEFVWHIVEKAADPRSECLRLPQGLQMIYATRELDGEVNNGGFHQFFWNSSGKLCDVALKGLKLVGDKDRIALLRKAMVIHAQDEINHPITDKSTMEQFEASEKLSTLGSLDDKYYKLKVDLEKLQIRCIRAHPEYFVYPIPKGRHKSSGHRART